MYFNVTKAGTSTAAVTSVLTLELIDAEGTTTPLETEFSFDPADPLAVTAAFLTVAGRVEWTFGRDLPVTPAAAEGLVEDVALAPGEVTVLGWATARPEPREVSWVLGFDSGRLVVVGWTPVKRADVAQRLGPAALSSGFLLRYPALELPKALRVFAVTGGRATELSR